MRELSEASTAILPVDAATLVTAPTEVSPIWALMWLWIVDTVVEATPANSPVARPNPTATPNIEELSFAVS